MIPRNCFLRRCLLGLSMLALFGWGRASAQRSAADLAAWIDRDVAAVLRVDMDRMLSMVSPEFVQQFAEQAGFNADQVESAKRIAQRVRQFGQEFTEAGGRQVWCVLSLADIPGGSPLIIVRGESGGDTKVMTTWLKKQCEAAGAADLTVAQHDDSTWLVAHANTLQRVRNQQPEERPELVAALDAIGDQPAVAVIHLSSDQRRVLREMLPVLPEPWRNVDGDLLADGVRWVAATLNPQAKIIVQIGIETRSAADARRLSDAVRNALQAASQLPQVQQRLPHTELFVKLLQPRVVDRQVRIPLEKGALQASLLQVISEPLIAARQAAKRQQCMNNFKQIGLAMHNYYEEHKAFPPVASRDEQGRPLLSWRVHLLPYLDAKSLYDQFHLDEPWDSEHNRKLIPQMPPVFVCPEIAETAQGKTTYLLPIGDGTVWGGAQPLSLQEITDGTSRTVMVIEAEREKAVEWTRPADLTVRSDAPKAGLGQEHGPGTLALFCDASVRFLSGDLPAETIWALFGAHDGKVVTE